jgi:hypothetical protein
MTQRTKSAFGTLYGSSGTIFADNTIGDISASDQRDQGQDILDSAMFIQDNFIDEDSMVTDSATKSPSQQSSKAYNDQVRFNRQTASYTLVLTDTGKMVEMNVASSNNLTVPPNSSVAFATGTQILLLSRGAGQTTVVAGSGVTVNSEGGFLKLTGQYSAATLIKVATNEWYLIGSLSA